MILFWGIGFIINLDRLDKNPQSESYIHLSFDDVIVIFEDLTNNEYSSVFEQPTLNYLYELHEKFNITVSFYCFYQNDRFNLSQCTDKYAKEFIENSSWLKFGFHDIDGKDNLAEASLYRAKRDYEKVINELLRITGSQKCIDIVPRLQNYAGSIEAINGMMSENTNLGIKGLLSADDDRISYYLTKEQSEAVFELDFWKDEENDLYIIPTDLRLENIDNPYEKLSNILPDMRKNKVFEIFTHEWALDVSMYEKIEQVVLWAEENNMNWSFAQNTFV